MKLTNKKRMEFLKNACNMNHNVDIYIEDLLNKPEVYLYPEHFETFERVVQRLLDNMNEIRKHTQVMRLQK